MKKWLIGCLMMVLLFTTTTAFAGHIKTDGSVCNSEGYTVYAGSENKTETQHKMQCQTCREVMWENHWKAAGDEPTCKKQARCGLCGLKFGPFGEHKFSEATCVAKATCTVCKLETGEIDPDNHNLEHHAAKAATCTERAGMRTIPAPGAATPPIKKSLRYNTTRCITMQRRPPALRLAGRRMIPALGAATPPIKRSLR